MPFLLHLYINQSMNNDAILVPIIIITEQETIKYPAQYL